jgi:hypothetical protein
MRPRAVRIASAFAAMIAAKVACAATPAATDDGDAATGAASDDGDESESAGDTTGSGRLVPVDLVFSDLWSAQDAVDPIPTHAPTARDCDIGFGDELGVFEIDTGLCNYGVFTQPAATEIFAGERVELTFTHDNLLAPEPATGHIAVAIAGTVVFSTDVAIPKPYDIVTGEWIAPASIPAGAPIVLHLHNHGYNNWRVVSITAEQP